jgi:lipid-A-disaccharide synthase
MKVMISCGEPSGDLYAGALTTEILKLAPGSRIYGLGGDHLGAAGGEVVEDYRGLTVTGLVEVLKILPRSWKSYRGLVETARQSRPDVFVAIDFPDFNFRLARSVRALGIPVVYYVSPQLWAWRSGRIRTMKAVADMVLVIFPFEEPIYQQAGVPVKFVGHPLVDLARATESRDRFLSELRLDPRAPTIALLPGSRPNEVRAILPVIGASLDEIRAKVPDVQFVVARAPSLDDHLFEPLASHGGGRLAIVASRADDVLAASDVVITASGTATVQAALHERPMVVVYRVSPLSYALGKPFVRVNTYAMANLVARRRIVPELMQDGFTPAAVAAEAVSLVTDRARAEQMRSDLQSVRQKLGQPGASRRAAEAVIAVARKARP